MNIISDSNSEGAITYYNINGIQTNHPSNGVYIEKTANAVKKIAVN